MTNNNNDRLSIVIFWLSLAMFMGLGIFGCTMYLGLSTVSVILGCIMGASLWFFLIIIILLMSFGG